MPGTYEKGKFDIAGFAVGFFGERIKLIIIKAELNPNAITKKIIIGKYSFKNSGNIWVYIAIFISCCRGEKSHF